MDPFGIGSGLHRFAGYPQLLCKRGAVGPKECQAKESAELQGLCKNAHNRFSCWVRLRMQLNIQVSARMPHFPTYASDAVLSAFALANLANDDMRI